MIFVIYRCYLTGLVSYCAIQVVCNTTLYNRGIAVCERDIGVLSHVPHVLE